MPAFNVKTFNSNENYAIDASAGTGKTYNIVQIVDKLLKDNKNLSLNEILIVTYTEKAAGELKDRIRAKIKGVDTDNAPISTFHSFCKSTIEEFPFAVNKPSNLSLVDNSEMEDFAKRYIREGTICNDIASAIVYLKRDDSKFSEDTLIKTFVKTCEKYYLDENGNEDLSVITLEPYIEFEYFTFKDINDAIAFDPEIGTNLSILKNSQDQKSKDFANELEEKFYNFSFNGTAFKKSSKWPTNQAEINAYDFFNKLKAKCKNGDDVYASLCSKYLKDFYIKWRKEKVKNNYQTFEDMICTVRESVLMNNSVLLTKLQEKYKYAIIDEFQDTNQKQFDIFKKVFLSDDKHGIIVVGDPKQSIYSFQGADVFVYKQAIEEIEHNSKRVGNKNSLDKNYRSTKSMVTSCNNMFSQTGWFGFSPSEYLSKSDNSDAKEFDVSFESKTISAFWISEDKDITETQYAKLVVQQIVDCCTKDANGDTKLKIKDKDSDTFRNVSFKDFTVLARVRSEMSPIESALSKAGIPYIRYKDNGLFKDNECAHWIAVLQAISELDFTGSRRSVFKKALFTDFFGLSLEEIDKKKFNSDNIWQVEVFRKWRALYSKGQYDTFIESVLIDSGLVKRMTNLNDIQKLNKYRQIGDYCSDYLSKKHTLIDLINKLSYLSKGGSDDDEDGAVVQKGTDFDCVQIMTIHASKGLQFPVVISVIGFKDYNNQVVNYVYHNADNNNQQTLTFNSNDFTKEERKNEMLRLLYVAYTRAQYVMMLPTYELSSRPSLTKLIKERTTNYIAAGKEYRPMVLSNKNFSVLSDEVKDMLPQVVANIDDKEKQDAENKLVIEARKKKQSYKHSYSNLSHPKKTEDEDEYDEDESILDKEGLQNEGLADYDKSSIQVDIEYDTSENGSKLSCLPKGSALGSALHEIFEKTNFKQYDKSSIDTLTEERFNHYLLPVSDDAKNEVFDIVDNVLTAKLPIINGSSSSAQSFSLNELDENDKKPEIEFNTNVLGGRLNNYFNGFIDLLFKRGEYYSVLDWKSDSLNDRDFSSYSSKESLKEHTDNSYSIQRVLYCYFLIEWLTLQYGEDREAIFNNHFGGIYYVYLRGCKKNTYNGIYAQTWNSYNDLKNKFDNIVNTLVVGGKKQ